MVLCRPEVRIFDKSDCNTDAHAHNMRVAPVQKSSHLPNNMLYVRSCINCSVISYLLRFSPSSPSLLNPFELIHFEMYLIKFVCLLNVCATVFATPPPLCPSHHHPQSDDSILSGQLPTTCLPAKCPYSHVKGGRRGARGCRPQLWTLGCDGSRCLCDAASLYNYPLIYSVLMPPPLSRPRQFDSASVV